MIKLVIVGIIFAMPFIIVVGLLFQVKALLKNTKDLSVKNLFFWLTDQ